MPPHVTNPDHSTLAVMTQAQYNASSDRDIQDLLRWKNLVITDHPVPNVAFNEDGLEVLNTTMEAVTTIQGTASYMTELVPWLTRIYPKTNPLTNRRITTCAVSKARCSSSWIVPRLYHLAERKYLMPSRFRWVKPISNQTSILASSLLGVPPRSYLTARQLNICQETTSAGDWRLLLVRSIGHISMLKVFAHLLMF